jgi:hypothetical protein
MHLVNLASLSSYGFQGFRQRGQEYTHTHTRLSVCLPTYHSSWRNTLIEQREE